MDTGSNFAVEFGDEFDADERASDERVAVGPMIYRRWISGNASVSLSDAAARGVAWAVRRLRAMGPRRGDLRLRPFITALAAALVSSITAPPLQSGER